ncbi:hypothetical protein BC938DRAFT_478482, partial [Jimgerdemannia flammicorona]
LNTLKCDIGKDETDSIIWSVRQAYWYWGELDFGNVDARFCFDFAYEGRVFITMEVQMSARCFTYTPLPLDHAKNVDAQETKMAASLSLPKYKCEPRKGISTMIRGWSEPQTTAWNAGIRLGAVRGLVACGGCLGGAPV